MICYQVAYIKLLRRFGEQFYFQIKLKNSQLIPTYMPGSRRISTAKPGMYPEVRRLVQHGGKLFREKCVQAEVPRLGV